MEWTSSAYDRAFLFPSYHLILIEYFTVSTAMSIAAIFIYLKGEKSFR